MAERSFAREVQNLRLGAGDEFRGEGILAVAKALLECGVGYVGGYQGAPISHLMDVFEDARPLLDELGVHYEASANESAAAAMLAASVMYPIRGAVTWKSTAGTNVASDALSNLSSSGVVGGALIVLGEDYGEGSSIMQERSHAFAMKSQIWLLDPRPNLESIVRAVAFGFDLSEISNTPVMLELRIRACHLHGRFIAKDNRRSTFSIADAVKKPRRDSNRIVLPPASFGQERDKLERRRPVAVEFIRKQRFNEFFGTNPGGIGIIMQGGMYNTAIHALRSMGLADSYGKSEISLYVLNVTYPLIESEVIEFCRDRQAVLVVEEGQPDFIEQNIHAILRKAGIETIIAGKGTLPIVGEYTADVMRDGIRHFLESFAPNLFAKVTPSVAPNILNRPEIVALRDLVPPRPAGFCTGCPERPIFSAIALVERELGQHHMACDIGCHLFSILPPFNLGATTMGYGLGTSSAAAFGGQSERRAISIMGDGGFWHNGLTSGVGGSVFNRNAGVTLIVDNHYSAATGGQEILSSRRTSHYRNTGNSIVKALRGVGVRWIQAIDNTYDVAKMRDALKAALTSSEEGPKIIVASSECMLNRQRRERPLKSADLAAGRRVVTTRFGVDHDICTGDHACIRLSGCPSLTLRPSSDLLKIDPVAYVDNTCVGCGNCGEVAEAAVLCPSFYRAEIVSNPNWMDRIVYAISRSIIASFQRWRESGRPLFPAKL